MWFLKKGPKDLDCDCIEINRRLVLLDREIQRLERQIARLEQQIVEQKDSDSNIEAI
jgi:prefoldin subunit 5